MATSWTFVETPTATAPVWAAFDRLSQRAQSASPSDAPKLQKAAAEIEAYLDLYRKIKTSSSSEIGGNLVKQIKLYELADISRFYACHVGPWTGIFWIDTHTHTCVSCFSLYASGRQLLAGPVENLALKRSPLIAGIFGYLEQFIVRQLHSEFGLVITLKEV